MKMNARIASLLLLAAAVLTAQPASSKMSIVQSKHNLSVSGPGMIKSMTEDRICVFCHTPHNANPLTPLWNKNIDPSHYASYDMYTSTTMRSAKSPVGPTGPSRLCLSCHDGTLALGSVLNPSTAITMVNVSPIGGMPTGRANFGPSLIAHHPVSFSYAQATSNPEIVPTPSPDLPLYGNGMMQCTTCHDAHDDSNRKFLRLDSAFSQLCTECHAIQGWTQSSHNTADNAWNGSAPNPWPRTGSTSDFKWSTVAQNGCENCHTPHSAGGPQRLLNYQEEENNCYPCHNGNVAARDIKSQFDKMYTHQVSATTIGITANHHEPNESPLAITGHVECVDCHNPHASTTQSSGTLSGKLANVSGVNISGSAVQYSSYEYEICFKCHGTGSGQAGMSAGFPIPRVVNTINILNAFQPANQSTHFVAGTAATIPDMPSIPSTYMPSLTSSSILTCTDCHDSDTSWSIGGLGPRGPHGSQYAPLVRQKYETVGKGMYLSADYQLCYWCHNQTSIESDASFGKNLSSPRKGGHSGHLTSINGIPVYAPCSACHDPHGVPYSAPGDHNHLINFATSPGFVKTTPTPVYNNTGFHSGSCTLVCHDALGNEVVHDGSATFSYQP